MNNYRIRRMQEKDAAAMAQIEAQIFSHPWTEENFRESFLLADTLYYVAEDVTTQTLIGYCGCYQSFDEGNISNVAVSPAWRRRGVASALLTELLEAGRLSGIRTFSLEVRVSNDAAIALYTGYGFQTAGIRRGFYAAPKEDAAIMLRSEND